MRAHGVPDFPDPRLGGGYSRSAVQAAGSQFPPRVRAAQQHCQQQAAAAGFAHTAAQTRQHVKQEMAFAACMRNHGMPKLPDPNAQGGFVGSPGSSWDPSCPAVPGSREGVRLSQSLNADAARLKTSQNIGGLRGLGCRPGSGLPEATWGIRNGSSHGVIAASEFGP
jgi:hypothetical protein